MPFLSWSISGLTVLIAMANPTLCASGMPAELMPTTSPAAFTSAPPELPWLIGASVWMSPFSCVLASTSSVRFFAGHDPLGDGGGVAEVEGVADRDHIIADANCIGITQRRGREPRRVLHSNECDVVRG